MTLCIILAIAAAVLGAIAVSTTCVSISSARHHRCRLDDRTQELGRANARIGVLEQMLDESRARILDVPAPQPRDARPDRAALPAEVLAELDEIEDPNARAELEADIRIQLEAHPEADPLVIAKRMIGGE